MADQKEYKLREYSPLTYALERFFRLLQFLPPQVLVGSRAAVKQPRDKAKSAARARKIELYVVCCVAVEIALGLLYQLTGLSAWLLRVPVGLRIIDIVQVSINVAVFDQLRRQEPHVVASIPRTLTLTFTNFLELMGCFGLLYLTLMAQLCGAGAWYDAFYFSVITQLTIGYGDIHPLGAAKALAMVQGIVGVILIVIVIGRVIAGFRKFEEIFPSDDRDDTAG